MQAKIFFSLLATLLAVGVVATPTRIKARDIKPSHGRSGPVTPFDEVAIEVGIKKPRPNGATIAPKDGDVPVLSTSVNARDLEILAKRNLGCVTIYTDPNFGGYSAYICPVTNDGCNQLNNYWRYNISSFAPDPEAFSQVTWCQIFTSTTCSSGGSPVFEYPGYGNLWGWDNNVGSFICWW